MARGKRTTIQQRTGQKLLPMVEFEDGSVYRAEPAEMAARIRVGKLFEGREGDATV